MSYNLNKLIGKEGGKNSIGGWFPTGQPSIAIWLLMDQFNSVFSTPKPDMIISDPVSFFSCQSIPIGAEINYLSDINFSESIIVESIKELSSNSAAGPDGFPSSLLINCSDILVPALKLMFSQSLSQVFSLQH